MLIIYTKTLTWQQSHQSMSQSGCGHCVSISDCNLCKAPLNMIVVSSSTCGHARNAPHNIHILKKHTNCANLHKSKAVCVRVTFVEAAANSPFSVSTSFSESLPYTYRIWTFHNCPPPKRRVACAAHRAKRFAFTFAGHQRSLSTVVCALHFFRLLGTRAHIGCADALITNCRSFNGRLGSPSHIAQTHTHTRCLNARQYHHNHRKSASNNHH